MIFNFIKPTTGGDKSPPFLLIFNFFSVIIEKRKERTYGCAHVERKKGRKRENQGNE